MNTSQESYFRKNLLDWYNPESRPLPWKHIDNPYYIWLSEIILQQTRVEQGLPYYLKFVKAYPSVADLAQAPDDEVMKNWEGLGYYSRARNMLAAARYIHSELNGQFPKDYAGILKLKGVGPYTAAAIASFAFDLPHAVLDGNVFRVLSRFFGIDTPVDSTDGKKQFSALAQACLDATQPALYNQAIMDFGATLCKPKVPDCKKCPLQAKCVALASQRIDQLPRKTKKIKKRERFFYYLEIQHQEEVLLQQRVEKDIWQQLYQFPLFEASGLLEDKRQLQSTDLWQQLLADTDWEILQSSKTYQQQLTHQKIHATYLKIALGEKPKAAVEPYFWHPRNIIQQFAFPKIIDRYLADNSLYLNL